MKAAPPLVFCALLVVAGARAEPLQFNRDIRPILSENCFHCHGQDPKHREADLRLDSFGEATRDLGGYAAVVPGHPEKSELIERLDSHDKDDVMPPPKSNRHVSPEQRETVRRWIAEGAEYQVHWAYLPPRKAEPPLGIGAAQPIDAFVRARLAVEKLEPAPAAAAGTWLRRVSLDLTGLPPSPTEVDAFAADAATRGDTAFSEAADRLLASPHFGERMAIDWLDVARYADTHGFNNDSERKMWRWRDWVIDAFNTNLPYDRFITEQLAGDLLPQPTLEQRIATGFARNHVINSEGGIIDEEYRVEYVADRVRTMSTAWIGLTFECCRCHDHKFDALTQRDYYQLFSFFNNVPEYGEDGRVDNAPPMIAAPTREQQATLEQQQRELAALDEKLAAVELAAEAREQLGVLAGKSAAEASKLGGRRLLENGTGENGIVGKSTHLPVPAGSPKIAGNQIDFAKKEGFTLAFWLKADLENSRDVPLFSAIDWGGAAADAKHGNGREIRLVDGEIEVRICTRFPAYAIVVRTVGAQLAPGDWRHIALWGSGGHKAADYRIFIDGREAALSVQGDGLASNPGSRELTVGASSLPNDQPFRGELDGVRTVPRSLSTAEIQTLFQAEALPYLIRQGAPTPAQQAWRRATLLTEKAPELSAQRAELWEKHLALRSTVPTSMVMQEQPERRPTFMLTRGQYDAHGEPVESGVPEQLIAPWPAGAPRNRLGLAQWLTQPANPLTARVVVNRFWAQLFGVGIVKTVEDFGSQGEWPSHPEALDWLARDFVDGGWNVKALLKTLVLSATYRQSSHLSPELAARDPENRLLARGPRGRLPAEIIRDQALAISGLLTPAIGGPSVFPYQPEKLYEGIVVGADYPGTKWRLSSGADLYRRSLYTYWKRTMPHPAMLTFDVPDREFCTARRSRTNTPLQALVLWNEPGYLEAARQLGSRMLREGGADDASRVAFAFQLATGRHPEASESRVLTTSLEKLRADFGTHREDAEALLKNGASPPDATQEPADLAAAMSVASIILNLDETISKN